MAKTFVSDSSTLGQIKASQVRQPCDVLETWGKIQLKWQLEQATFNIHEKFVREIYIEVEVIFNNQFCIPVFRVEGLTNTDCLIFSTVLRPNKYQSCMQLKFRPPFFELHYGSILRDATCPWLWVWDDFPLKRDLKIFIRFELSNPLKLEKKIMVSIWPMINMNRMWDVIGENNQNLIFCSFNKVYF